MTHDYKGELDCAERAATASGTMLRQAFHSGARQIDHQAEEEIRKILTAGFPQYGYLGVELDVVRGEEAGGCGRYLTPRGRMYWMKLRRNSGFQSHLLLLVAMRVAEGDGLSIKRE